MNSYNRRHQEILSYLEQDGQVSVQKLSELLKVSLVTIRKDLSFLEEKGYLYRTHGGASKKPRYAFEKNVSDKELINVAQKKSIVKKALKYIKNNDFLILGSGTTIHYLARIIDRFDNLTVLTSSLGVSLELCKTANVHAIQLGGEVRKSSTSTIGAFAESILKDFSCNKLFLGVDGIDVEFGISTSNAAEAHLNRIMIEQAEQVFVLADSSKINKKGFGKICHIKHIDYLITDSNIDNEDLKRIEEAGVNVVVA